MEAGLVAASSQPPAPSQTATGLTGAALLAAVAEARGMPESLVERSAKARAKKTDASLEDVLNEWALEAGVLAASDQLPATSFYWFLETGNRQLKNISPRTQRTKLSCIFLTNKYS